VEDSFDVVDLAITSGATYVARSTVFHYNQMVRLIQKALEHRGAAVVEILTNCHTYYGRYNAMPEATRLLQFFKDNAVTIEKSKKMEEEELTEKIVVGEFRNIEKETYTERYDRLVKQSLAMSQKE